MKLAPYKITTDTNDKEHIWIDCGFDISKIYGAIGKTVGVAKTGSDNRYSMMVTVGRCFDFEAVKKRVTHIVEDIAAQLAHVTPE